MLKNHIEHFFTGNPLSRQSFYREAGQKLLAHLGISRFLLFNELNFLYNSSASRIAWLNWDQVCSLGIHNRFSSSVTSQIGESMTLKDSALTGAPQTSSLSLQEGNPATLIYLGSENMPISSPGTSYWAIDVTNHSDIVAQVTKNDQYFAEMRPTCFLLPKFDAACLSQSRPLIDWHQRYKFCTLCGGRVEPIWLGYKQACSKKDCLSAKSIENVSYPRTDPVVIVCITDSSFSRLLLGRSKRFPPNLYSCIAGFVEPGESVEEAAGREALEETNLSLQKITYHSSQPWPFPSQLMLGCHAIADPQEEVKLNDGELEDAQWFTRAEIQGAFERVNGSDSSRASSLRLPPPTTIAHMLIKSWLLSIQDSQSPNKL